MVAGSLCLNFDIFRNTAPLTDSGTSNSSDLLFIYLVIYSFTSFSGHRHAQRECARTGLIGPMQGAIPAQSHKGWPHHRGLRPLRFSNSDVGSFTSHKNKSVKVLREKTGKSNHLQMSSQRQHFLLSYLKTLSVGPAGV